MKKICFFSGVFFPKVPYLDYNIYFYLKDNNFDITFILKKNDVRIKGVNDSNTLIEMNSKKYNNIENIKIIENLIELKDLTKKYDLFLCTNLVVDRLEMNFENFFDMIKIKKCIIDICGYDIIKKNYFNNHIDYFLVKGKIFKEWLIKLKVPEKNIEITGSPLFDYCFPHNLKSNYNYLNKNNFCDKYNLNKNKKIILITTTNLRSPRTSMNHQNLEEFKKLYKKFKNDYNFILLSYPNDYLFYEVKKKYRRSENKYEIPDYQYMINNFEKLKVIKVNDNYNALKNCNYIFNLSAGALSIETILLFNKISFTMHFKDKEYYMKKIGYSDFVEFPDNISNIHLNNIMDIFNERNIDISELKKKLNNFISIDNAHNNIANALKKILTKI